MTHCYICGGPTEIVIIPEQETTWGMPESEHGSHTFTLKDVPMYQCTVCGEGFFNWEQCQVYERQLNELIKEKLGIDWLAECAARRVNSNREK
jgi:YgiT-type zinc finger domain-containing protein